MDALEMLRTRGMLLESAHGPIPNLAELVVGAPIRGSWWGHPRSRAIFDAINEVRGSPDVIAVRLVRGKITLVHRRLWPALVRLADRYPASALAAIRQEHTVSGAHASSEVPFPDWVPADVMTAAGRLSRRAALEALPECLR